MISDSFLSRQLSWCNSRRQGDADPCSHVITAAIELTIHMHACMSVYHIAESTELAKACRHASAIPPALHKWINFHRFDKVNHT